MTVKRRLYRQLRGPFDLYRRALAGPARTLVGMDLIRHTDNFSRVTWLGQPVWQNVLDLWIAQEVISEIKPELIIECGTYQGGSALFYASIFDLLGNGSVVTIDVNRPDHLHHPRVTFVHGSSTNERIVRQVRERAATYRGPVMVILDSDHSQAHVRRELEAYGPLVSVGSYIWVQDGVIDVLPIHFSARPGPLRAIEDFLRASSEFSVDDARTNQFLLTAHPKGWLRRVQAPAGLPDSP